MIERAQITVLDDDGNGITEYFRALSDPDQLWSCVKTAAKHVNMPIHNIRRVVINIERT